MRGGKEVRGADVDGGVGGWGRKDTDVSYVLYFPIPPVLLLPLPQL